uniref:Reverse transcriptase n=1 Tax=Leptobrachium leishanense TaxID=445787 RepID=A0A8C5PZ97_9ANUR
MPKRHSIGWTGIIFLEFLDIWALALNGYHGYTRCIPPLQRRLELMVHIRPPSALEMGQDRGALCPPCCLSLLWNLLCKGLGIMTIFKVSISHSTIIKFRHTRMMSFLLSPIPYDPSHMKELRTFQTLSNFLINDTKCKAMGVGVSPDLYQALTDICPFQWTRNSLRYLGTTLTRCPRDLFAANYTPLLNTTLHELRKWHKPHISWLGRINYLKMTVLPKFLYIFQAVPVKIPRALFQALKSGFLKFIWGATCPRISYKDMIRPRDKGGLGLPHLESYYHAALLTRICDWSISPPVKLWVALEKFAKYRLHLCPGS